MATFPTGILINRIILMPLWKTLVTTFDGANEQRRQKWAYPKYDVKITFHKMPKADMETLWEFYMARKGAYESFYVYDIITADHVKQYIGTGDGSVVTFDIPGKSTSGQTVYVNDAAQSVTITYDGGASASDQITFSSAPALGDVISCSFTGYLRIRCRFNDDKMSRENLYKNIFQIGLILKGIEFV